MSVKAVTDTGMRGFLKWFKQVQPNQYATIARVLPSKVPQAFSGYHEGGWATAGMNKNSALNKLNGIYAGSFSRQEPQALGDYYACLGITVEAPAYTSLPVTTDYFASAMPAYTAANPSYFSTPIVACAPTAVDTAAAANTGMTSTATTSNVGAIIGAVAGAALTATELAQQQQLVNTQLQRAAAGLAPLTVGLPSGVPVTGSTTGIFSGSSLFLLLALGGGLLLLTGSKST